MGELLSGLQNRVGGEVAPPYLTCCDASRDCLLPAVPLLFASQLRLSPVHSPPRYRSITSLHITATPTSRHSEEVSDFEEGGLLVSTVKPRMGFFFIGAMFCPAFFFAPASRRTPWRADKLAFAESGRASTIKCLLPAGRSTKKRNLSSGSVLK